MVMLAEAERLVIDAEVAAGDSAAEAVRPLFPHEVAAKVRFGDIAALTNEAVAEAATALAGLREVIVGSILGEMLGDADEVTPTAAARALAQLNAAQPLQVQTAVARTAGALQGILARVANSAAGMVQGEAVRQGVKMGDWAPPAIDAEQFKLPAATAALHPWQRITGKLQTTIIDPSKVYAASIPRDDVVKELDNIPLDGSVDLAKQTIHSAHGIGRVAAAEELNPSEIFATEILDGNTCKPCARMDGKEYESMEAAKRDYPHGGYDGCLGGTRCRGTLVFMYDEPDPIVDDPNPEPLPPIKPEPTPAPAVPKKKRAPRKPKPVVVPDPEPVVPTPAPAPAPAPKVEPKVTPAVPPAKPQTRKEALAAEKLKQAQEEPGVPKAPTAAPPPRRKGETQRYTALNQLPVNKDIVTDTPMLVAKYTNPGHDKVTGTRFYNMNCSSVVQAYEFQRRGYDVKAAPVADGKGRADRIYVSEWWRDKDGQPAQMSFLFTMPEPLQPNGKRLAGNKWTKTVPKLNEWARDYPDGARGFVAMGWTQGGAHVFNWEKVDGKLMFLEGQTGDWDASKHFEVGKFKPDTVRIVRIDDKEPTELVTQAFETRPREFDSEVGAAAKASPTGRVPVLLTSAEKKAKAQWRFKLQNGKAVYLPPEFRKNKSNRWEPIPEKERQDMLAEFMKNGNRT